MMSMKHFRKDMNAIKKGSKKANGIKGFGAGFGKAFQKAEIKRMKRAEKRVKKNKGFVWGK